jgi:hypothetical protein
MSPIVGEQPGMSAGRLASSGSGAITMRTRGPTFAHVTGKRKDTALIKAQRSSPLLRHTGLVNRLRGECDMRVPQVKEGPASALRAMFAGIGQLLSITDKLRGKSGASPDPETVIPTATPRATAATQTLTPEATVPETAAPETAAPETAAPETAAPTTAAPEAAATETVLVETVIPEVKAAAKPRTAAKPRAAAKPAAAKPAPAAPAAEDATAPGGHVRLIQADETPAAPADAAPSPAVAADAAAGAELPLANYDELTIPSLRARLRNLSADQLGQLIAYEKSHADRADVITMFERRVAKLAEG